MATSVVEIFNMALSAAGTSSTVSTVDEKSREAETCQRWYGLVRDLVLGAAPWPSATAYARLSRVAERDMNSLWQGADPAPSYRYAYAIPADLIRPYHLQDFARFEYRGDRIFCMGEAPILFYIKQETDVSKWSADLTSAVVHLLASKIAPQYKGDDNTVMRLVQQAFIAADDAMVAAANSQQELHSTMPDWIQARGYGGGMPLQRYYFPFDARNIEASL